MSGEGTARRHQHAPTIRKNVELPQKPHLNDRSPSDNPKVIQLIIASGGCNATAAAVAQHVLDALQMRLRSQYIDIFRPEEVAFGPEFGTRTFTLDPPSAGLLTVTYTCALDGSHTITFAVTGIAEVTLAAPLRALVQELSQSRPRLDVNLIRTKKPPRDSISAVPRASTSGSRRT